MIGVIFLIFKMSDKQLEFPKVNYYFPPYQIHSGNKKRLYDMYDCIMPNGKISEQCAKNIGGNHYLVNEDVMLKTRGKLTESSYLPFSKDRNINTSFIFDSYQSFYHNKRLRTIQSECVTPYGMLYEDSRKYDIFPITGKTINGVLIKKDQIHCVSDLFTTYIDDYNKV